jgi:hypothetical protein
MLVTGIDGNYPAAQTGGRQVCRPGRQFGDPGEWPDSQTRYHTLPLDNRAAKVLFFYNSFSLQSDAAM